MIKPNIKENKLYVSLKKRPETKHLVVHCSATQNLERLSWKDIDAMHRQQGWICIGYHYVIRTDGTIEQGRPLESVGSHVKGHNSDSVGICLIGGINREGASVDNFTVAQKNSLLTLLRWLRNDVYRDVSDMEILGHRDFEGVHKDCPCFNVKEWLKSNGGI